MTMKKTRDVVAFALAMGLLLVLVGHVSASSNSTIYSFGTTQPLDGAVPKGSLTYVNGLMFGARLPSHPDAVKPATSHER